MSERTQFTDDEIETIRYNFFRKFDLGIKWGLPLLALMCLVMPYLPGRRGRGPLIERMDYADAVIMYTVILVVAVGISLLWQNDKLNKEYRQLRASMRKKKLSAKVVKKKKSIFKSYHNRLITDLEGELETIEIDKAESEQFNVGDTFQIEIEEQTNTVLNIFKENQ